MRKTNISIQRRLKRKTCDCPRWDEINEYLGTHYEPTKLAIETMGMISGPLFLRYIRDLVPIGIRPLELTHLEFTNFLGTAGSRGELFFYVSDILRPI
jgi:hypothetical protein